MPANKDFALRIEIIDECLRNNLRKWTLEHLIGLNAGIPPPRKYTALSFTIFTPEKKNNYGS